MPPSPVPSTPVAPSRAHDGTSPFPPDGPVPAPDGGERPYLTVAPVIFVLPSAAVGLVGSLLRAGRVRVAPLRHVAWSMRRLCPLIGDRPFRTRGHSRATSPWRPALLSFGESGRSLHHSHPTSARHGVGRPDPSAAVIGLCEHLGRAHEVRPPTRDRFAARRA